MVEYVLAQGAAVPWIGPAVRAALFTAAGATLATLGLLHILDLVAALHVSGVI